MNDPFAVNGGQIPVRVVTSGALPPVLPGTALVALEGSHTHQHDGDACLVCAARGNIRVLLFDLLEEARRGAVAPFSAVLVDARRAERPQAVIDALVPGRLPAFGMRDHFVAKSFRLDAFPF